MEIAYDERGLVPVVVQDWSTGEVLTLAYANAEALARTRETGELHLWSRSRERAVAQGRDVGQHPGASARCAWTATATRCSRSSSRPARPATPARARASTTASSSRRRRTRRCPALERTLAAARPSGPRAPTPSQLLDDPPLIGAKVEEEAEEVARAAREETDERVDEEAADVLYHLTRPAAQPRPLARRRRGGRSMAVAAERARRLPVEPSLDEVRELARDHNLIPLRHTFIDDCETPVSAFLKLRGRNPEYPAFLLESAEQGQRVGRYSFIGVRPRSVAALVARRRGRPLRARRRGGRALEPGAAARTLPPFSGGAVGYFGYDLVRTVEPLGEPNPDRSGCRTWR